MQNFSFLAGLEMTEKFVCGGFQVATVSNLTELHLSCFELS